MLAYLDPGTGGMLIGAVAAGAAGAAVTVKSQWARLRGRVSRSSDVPEEQPAAEPTAEPDNADNLTN